MWNTWELVYTATRLEGEACFFPFFAFGLSSNAVILTHTGVICLINYPWKKLGTTPILHIKNHECYSKLNYFLAADKGKVSGREVEQGYSSFPLTVYIALGVQQKKLIFYEGLDLAYLCRFVRWYCTKAFSMQCCVYYIYTQALCMLPAFYFKTNQNV